MMTNPDNEAATREHIKTSGRVVRATPDHDSMDSAPTEPDVEKSQNAEDLHRQMFIRPSPAAAKDIRSRVFDKSMWPRP